MGTAEPVENSAALRRLRAVVERLERDGSMVAASDGSTHDVRTVAIPPAEGDALRTWVVRERARRTVEVGLGYGVSALHICEGLLRNAHADARHVVLDPFQTTRFASCGLQVLDEAGVASLVEWHDEVSQVALPAFLREGRQFDLAFVDGNHRFDSVFVDLFFLGRLVRRGGIIALDDYNLPGIERAVSFFRTNLGWTTEEVASAEEAHRWVVLRTSTSEDARDFRHFVDF